jgi:hypothetical protein
VFGGILPPRLVRDKRSGPFNQVKGGSKHPGHFFHDGGQIIIQILLIIGQDGKLDAVLEEMEGVSDVG